MHHRAMRFIALALLLVACGNRDREREPERQSPTSRPTKKPMPPAGCETPGGNVCVDEDVVECLADRTLGKVVQQCNGGCNAGKCIETCALRDVELVYVVDDQHTLLSFDPKKLPNDPFHSIGKLTCDSRSSPFSMAVDRLGVAWVNYHSGAVYRVSIVDGKCMQARFPANAPNEFGMGFVSDGPKADTEKLFVSGYESGAFAHLDVTPKKPVWNELGKFSTKKNPELTGTGGGQLFGFFPEDGNDAFVQEIDRANGKLIGKRMRVGSPKGQINGWAFAHWGGNFYVFVTIDDVPRVFEIDGKTGTSKRVIDRGARNIVGAGVSTCAPLLESVAP